MVREHSSTYGIANVLELNQAGLSAGAIGHDVTEDVAQSCIGLSQKNGLNPCHQHEECFHTPTDTHLLARKLLHQGLTRPSRAGELLPQADLVHQLRHKARSNHLVDRNRQIAVGILQEVLRYRPVTVGDFAPDQPTEGVRQKPRIDLRVVIPGETYKPLSLISGVSKAYSWAR